MGTQWSVLAVPCFSKLELWGKIGSLEKAIHGTLTRVVMGWMSYCLGRNAFEEKDQGMILC